MRTQRRDFLKLTTAGATGLVLARAGRAHAAWPTTGTLTINPNISNTLVVACNDSTMIKSTPTAMTFAAENAAVDATRVAANMDAMAMQLANTTTAADAWKAIFRSSKAWASTVVAIKVNCIEVKNMARVAVIQKFCSVLANLGVQPANIIIYDGNTTFGAGISNYSSYFSLTDTTKIQAVVSSYNGSLGGTTNATLPDGTTATCTANIANGTVDILINIANNKGHSMFGGSTLCMKNHFGTFAPNHTNLASYVFNINKSDAIVGGSPVRQQLCFIDSLFANKASNTGTPEVMPCYLIMGTCAPIVDYLTVKKVREAVLSCTHDETIVSSFLTSFGYSASDPVWVLVPPASSADAGAGDASASGTGSGGSTGSGGGTGAGGSSGTGGSSASNGGSSGTAGSTGSGGSVSGSGGAGKGGSAGSAGSGSGGGGTLGGNAGSASGGAGASGTTVASGSGGSAGGGASGGSATGSSSGCGCDVGGAARGANRFAVPVVLGALVTGQLRRLLDRKQKLARSANGEPSDKATATQDEDTNHDE